MFYQTGTDAELNGSAWSRLRVVRPSLKLTPAPRGQTEFEVNLKRGLTSRKKARERRIVET